MNMVKIQVDSFLEHCKTGRRLADHSIWGYSIDLRMFMEFLESLNPPITECRLITKEELDGYVASVSGKYKVKTIKRKLACIRSFFTYLEDRDIVEVNPFDRFRLQLREPKRRPISLTVSETERFLKAVYTDSFVEKALKMISMLKQMERPRIKTLTGEFFWIRDVAIIELLFAAGLRVAELCSLQFENYDPIENSFYIIGKGNRERILYLDTPEVIAVFENYLFTRKAVETNHSFIFITRFRDPMSTQGVRNLVTKYSEISGINKNITPHVFRHSFASLLLESGVDIKYIQEFLGHSTISTTQIYLHTSEEAKRKILAEKHPRNRIHETIPSKQGQS